MAAAARASLDTGLRFLLDEKQVPEWIQDKVAEEGITSVAQFANIDTDKAAVRRLVTDEWNVSADTTERWRAVVASFLDAWEASTIRASTERQEAATARTNNLPRPMPKADHIVMKVTFEDKYWKLNPETCPSPAFIELRLNMIEEGEQTAEPLTKVTARADAEDLSLGIDMGQGEHPRGAADQERQDAARSRRVADKAQASGGLVVDGFHQALGAPDVGGHLPHALLGLRRLHPGQAGCRDGGPRGGRGGLPPHFLASFGI